MSYLVIELTTSSPWSAPNGAGKNHPGTKRARPAQAARRRGLATAAANHRLHAAETPVDATLPLSVLRFLRLVQGQARANASSVPSRRGASSRLPLQAFPVGELRRVLAALCASPSYWCSGRAGAGRVDVASQAELCRLIGKLRDRCGCGVLMVSDLHLVMAPPTRWSA